MHLRELKISKFSGLGISRTPSGPSATLQVPIFTLKSCENTEHIFTLKSCENTEHIFFEIL